MIRTLTLVTTLLLLLSPVSQAEPVKKSKSAICHDTSSPYYERVTNFTAYDSLTACLSSGGRLHKGAAPSTTKAVKTPPRAISDYQRDKFGRGWSDDDGDCVNTRHELLLAQSTSTVDRGNNKCTINRGRWLDPYTGKTFYDAQDVDIDHLVPLKWAWDHGADQWTDAKREQFANDEINLFIVEDSVNRQKGAKGPLEWLPPASSFHCQYITRFQRVVIKYGLLLSGEEKQGMDRLKAKVCQG